jgi:hypothetical protein
MTTIAELDRRYHPDLQPDAVVLDAGAGRGLRFPHAYKS